MKTVFITGASSGIGRETAILFQKRGWNVIAAMRNPQAEDLFKNLEHVKAVQCDVTDLNSIKNAVQEGINAFSGIDVLVNNAGYYLLGSLEEATHEQIRQQIETNLLGLIAVTKEVVPYFRKQKSGTIINLSSIAGIVSIPLQSLYCTTKWGVEGFSETLQYELRPFHIRVKIIEPGVIKTNFLGRSMTLARDDTLAEYASYSNKIVHNIFKNGEKASMPEKVAEAVFKAATDEKTKLRYSMGYLHQMTLLRRMLPQKFFTTIVRTVME